MVDLLTHIAELGVRVRFAHMTDDPHLLGYYSPAHRTIVVRVGMTRAQTRWVLAHEAGHAHYDHHCRGVSANSERQANAYGARLLIDPAEYARLERINSDPHWLADEFGVSVECIHAFEEHCLTRLRGVTYTSARMGIGQWSYRAATL